VVQLTRSLGVRVALTLGCMILPCANPGMASDPGTLAPAWPNPAPRLHVEASTTSSAPSPFGVPSAARPPLLLSTKELVIPSDIRLMVFAPHPDDETLGAGGLIQRVLARGGAVRVVFVTNGDGYVDGVRCAVHRDQTSTADFIEYGRRRHDEAARALHRLGLSAADAVFLGFPDDGIDDLWSAHWSAQRPYTSPYTRFDRPAYQESLSRDVE